MSNPMSSDLHLKLVPGSNNPALLQSIVSMWLGEGVLTHAEASRRIGEVVYAIIDHEETVHGVTTAYSGQFPARSEPFWFLRMFIRKSARKALGLKNHSAFQWDAFEKTCQFLAETTRTTHRGVVMVTENRKLWSERWQKRLGGRGWKVLGKDGEGHVIFFLPFQK